MAESGPKFTFQYLGGKKFWSLDGKDETELYTKWSVHGRMKAQTFSFDQQFQPYQKDDFTLAFFQDPVVIQNLQVVSPLGKWRPLGQKATSVSAEPMCTTALSLTFFDRLYENNIVRESGSIARCFDEVYDDFLISNELRKLLVVEESDNYDLFDENDRKELIFCIFSFLCLGGSVCQFDDDLNDYCNLTKKIYKDLVSVQKDPSTNDLHIISSVFKVTASDTEGPYYPSDKSPPHLQDFAYLIVDPLKRHATIFYHKFGATIIS